MNPQNRQPPGGLVQDLRTGYSVLLLAARVASAPVLPWVRRPGTWGERFLGWPEAVGALGFLPVSGAFVAERVPVAAAGYGALIAFYAATLALFLAHRVAGVRRRARGEHCHSRYVGDPMVGPRGLEPLLAGAVPFGLGVACQSVCLLAYAPAAAASLALVTDTIEAEWDARVRAARDARIEGELMSRDLSED